MSMKVVITKAVPEDLVAECLGDLTVVQGPSEAEWTLEEAAPHLADCDGMVTWGFIPVNAALLERAPRLKVVANIAVGYDNLDLAALSARRVWACNVPTAFAVPTAEVALGLIIAVMRRIGEGERYVRAGAWRAANPGRFDGPTLAGKTLGLIGFGNIAQAVARRAKAFEMRMIYYSRRRAAADIETALAVDYSSLDDLLRTADVVSLHVPLTEETRHLINAQALALMKPTAYLINTARGKVVDEAALIAALQAGKLAGAGLDVFEHEPRVPEELFTMPNVVLTPHLGGAATEARREAQRTALLNVRTALIEGRPLTPINNVSSTG